jgi:hypothetical protein
MLTPESAEVCKAMTLVHVPMVTALLRAASSGAELVAVGFMTSMRVQF